MANFYQQVDKEYGTAAKILLKNHASNVRKLGNMLNRKDFLIKCCRRGMFPAHITNSFRYLFPLLEENSPYLNELSRHTTRFKKAVLNVEIKHTFFKIKQLKASLHASEVVINATLVGDESTSFLTNQQAFLERHQKRNRLRTDRKLENLTARCIEATISKTPSYKEKALYNDTGIKAPQEVELLLSLGSKFALPSDENSQTSFFHLIADVEDVLHTHPDREVQERNRCNVANQIQNYVHKRGHINRDPTYNFCQSAAKATKAFLKQHPEIVVVEADKGNKTVMMLKEDYDTKLQGMIDADDTYKKLARDPTSMFQRQNNQIAKRLADLKLINRREELKLKTYRSSAPCIYGAPKAHKPGLPLRPVVPCMTSPSYELSKYIGNIMQKSIQSKYNVKDSFSFCDFVNNITLPVDHVMVSFDVVSLFTCIPKDLVLRNIIDRWDDIRPNTEINLDLFLEIVNFCIDCSYFRFRGNFYQQIFGTAMGNPLSPIVADLVMEQLLDTVTTSIDFSIPVVKKYVDDLFLAIPESKIQEVANVFNGYHPKIKFTVEAETNGRLPYLDLMLVRKIDQTIRTEWYIKPIASGRFMNYHSFHSMRDKMNVARNFISRVQTFSTNVPRAAANATITNHLRLNDYPQALINRLLNRSIRQNTSTIQQTAEGEKRMFKSLVNIAGLTSDIQSKLRVDYQGIRISTRQTRKIKTLLPNVKDEVDKDSKYNVVYKIPCADCDANYVGMTTNMLKTRVATHRAQANHLLELCRMGRSPSDQEIISLKEKTALLEHCANTSHAFAFDRVEVLDGTSKPHNLAVLEMCHITNTSHTVNRRNDTDSLSRTYAGILHSLKAATDRRREKEIGALGGNG